MVVNFAEVDLSKFYSSVLFCKFYSSYLPVGRASRVAPFIYCSLNDSIVLEYLLSLTKTMYKVQRKILNNQIIN